jgi:microcystin-dependent protein
MANKRITELTLRDNFNESCNIPIDDTIQTYRVTGQQLYDFIKSFNNMVPTGVINAFAGSTAPSGWLICDGSAVSRSTYSDLFAVIGVTHGVGDGSTTFNLPDFRDKFIKGKNADALGATGGASTHSHTVNSHTHGDGTLRALIGATDGGTTLGWTKYGTTFSHQRRYTGFSANVSSTTTVEATDVAGNTDAASPGTNSQSNLPPYQTENFIIKT